MNSDYPYWRDEFEKEFKGFKVYYREKGWKKGLEDVADGYRVFMILCNNNYDKSRKHVLEMLRDAKESNPIVINDELFWTEQD